MKRLFRWVWNLLAVIGLVGVLSVGFIGATYVRSHELPPRLLALKALKKFGFGSTALARWVEPDPVRPPEVQFPDPGGPDWTGHGARPSRNTEPLYYAQPTRAIPGAWVEQGHPAERVDTHRLQEISVRDVEGFRRALRAAEPGQAITLEPGTYRIKSRSIEILRAGTFREPIVVRARRLGEVTLELNSLEGFWVNAPFWVFENLEIRGACANDDYCEHAFHVVGKGGAFVLRNCRLHEFNSVIKGNGEKGRDGVTYYPDGALIENNTFYNSRPRDTGNATNAIDVVGANDWVVRGNFIADFAKLGGDRISYAAFIKGNSSGGVFENNLVIGEYRHTGGVRVGLSFGGGGTGKTFARGGELTAEHTGGIVRNNVVMYFSDVGLYLNRAAETHVYNNLFYGTMGVDVRFPVSSAALKNNLLTSRIKSRDDGLVVEENNWIAPTDATFSQSFADWYESPGQLNFSVEDRPPFLDAGVPLEPVWEDICGGRRASGSPDGGPFEYPLPPDCRMLPHPEP